LKDRATTSPSPLFKQTKAEGGHLHRRMNTRYAGGGPLTTGCIFTTHENEEEN